MNIGIVILEGNDKVIIQSADYIEDGWYIEVIGTQIMQWEIPLGGGDPIKISEHPTIASAISSAINLY